MFICTIHKNKIPYIPFTLKNNTEPEGSVIFNLRANYQVNDSLDIYAGVDNVFGAKYYNSVTLSSGDRLYDPAPRTTYYTGFKYKF